MIHDLAEDPPDELPDYKLCVVGSGPAGIAVTSELASRWQGIAVLESGRFRRTEHGDELNHVLSDGIRIKGQSRERVLGGASTTWSGVAAPLDPVDLAPRPFMSRSGWPIAHEELFLYYEEAARRYGFPPLELFGQQGFAALRAHGGLQPTWRDLEEKVFLAASEPRDFGRDHRGVFERPGVDLWLDATVVRLEAAPGRRRVARAILRTSGGSTLAVRAQEFVLAAGGIENARLLLNSRDLCAEGLGNEHDQVGRHFMNHPKNPYGVLHLARPADSAPYFYGAIHGGYVGYAGVRLRPVLQHAHRVLDSYVRFEPLSAWSDNAGVASLAALVARSRRFLSRRKARAPRIRHLRLWNFMEMEPDPENRVLLSNQRDAYGELMPFVRHRCTELDRHSLVALHEALGAEVHRLGLGRLESRLGVERRWPIDLDASHHMGSTRMGTDPRVSVVDPDCKLHGVENVFVAGASVFPTSGCANPTFTLVALAIRLARHLDCAVLDRPRDALRA